jgi:hypothetical protein
LKENIFANLQTISGTDFVNNAPEIYLALIIFVSLIIVGTANFTPSATLITQKKEITLTLYELARVSLALMFLFYLFTLRTT